MCFLFVLIGLDYAELTQTVFLSFFVVTSSRVLLGELLSFCLSLLLLCFLFLIRGILGHHGTKLVVQVSGDDARKVFSEVIDKQAVDVAMWYVWPHRAVVKWAWTSTQGQGQ